VNSGFASLKRFIQEKKQYDARFDLQGILIDLLKGGGKVKIFFLKKKLLRINGKEDGSYRYFPRRKFLFRKGTLKPDLKYLLWAISYPYRIS